MMLLYVTIVGPSGLMRDGRHVTAFADTWFESVTQLPMSSAMPYIIMGFKSLVEKDMANKTKTAEENLQYFVQNWAKMPILSGGWVTGVFSIPLVLISPGFWIYLTTMWKGRNPSFSVSLNLYGIVYPTEAMTPGAIQFDLLDMADLASIEWSDRPSIKAQLGLSVDLIKEVEVLISADLQANPCMDLSTEVIIDPPKLSDEDKYSRPSSMKVTSFEVYTGDHCGKDAVPS
jgi:hypothetical protein